MAKKKKESLSRTLAEVSKGVTKTVANDKSVSAKVRKQAKSDYRKASRISNSSASKNYISNSRLRRAGGSGSTSATSASMANRMRGESASQRNAGGNTIREIARSNTPKKNSVSRTYSELQNKTKDMNLTDTAVGRGMARAGLTAKGTAKEVYGGVKTTFSAIRDPNEERNIKADQLREQRGEQTKGNKYEGAYDKLRNAQRDNREQREKDLKSASKMLESASADKEKAKKGLGKAGKFALDVESALLGMAGDAAVGAVTGTGQVGALGSMAVRSFGGAYNSAKKEGASDSQAALYAAVTGGKEVLTEKMFNVGKAFSGVFGKGLGDDVINKAAEKGAEKLAKKFGSEGAKNVILHGSNYLASALTEGLEEVASTASDPFVANAIYARAVGNPHSFDAGDTFYDFLVGAALGGLGGGIAEASNYSQGGQVKNVLGKDGLKEVADRVAYADEDSGISDSAKAISQMILNGEDVANAQALKLYKAAEAQEQKNFTQYRDAIKGATSIIERDNLISPSGLTVDESGQVIPTIGDNTNIKFQEARTEARNEVEKLQLKDDVAASIGDTIASIETGIGVVDDIETIVRYPEAKAVYESVTGETLPSGRKALMEYLYKKNAENRVQSAREETEFWKDQAVGLLSQTETEDFGGNGQAVFTKATENLDVNELGNSALTKVRTTINDYYNSAKLGIPFSTLNDIAKPEYDAVSEDIKREAYNAGILDSNDIYKYLDGIAVNKDESIKSSANKENRNANPGKLYVDADNAARKYFTNSQQKMWKALAEEFSVGIHIMDAESFADALRAKGQNEVADSESLPNGFYDNGEIYLNVETPDRATRYVFMHEFTHFLEQTAPKEYSELRKRMIDALIEDGSLERRLSRKRMQYGEGISQDDLIDEILADSTYEFLNDKDFANGIARESGNLAQAIINAIRNLIRKIRNVLARDEYTPSQNANMYAQLGILKDMEALWLDAVNAARGNAGVTEPTRENGDMQFSMKESVEETEELIAIHNLSFDKLNKTLELGGLPMPSIAITKARQGHTKFGEVSLVFGKDTIDPEGSSANTVYSGDAYTPTFPSIDYELNEKKAEALYARANKVGAVPMFNPVILSPLNIKDELKKWGGEAGLLERFKNDYGIKNFYLAETSTPVSVVKSEKAIELDADEAKRFDSILKLIPDEIGQLGNMTGREWNKLYGEQFKDAQKEAYRELNQSYTDEALSSLVDNVPAFRQIQIAQKIKRYAENGATEVERFDDYEATNAEIDKRLDESKYNEWLKELFKGIVKSKGIRNNKDTFTPNGNRRNFGILHYEYNLENIVKAMKEEESQGKNTFGGGNIRGAAAEKLGSVDEIKQKSSVLQNMTEEEYNASKREFDERFHELTYSLAKEPTGFTDAAALLVEAIVRNKTKSGIASYIKREGKGWTNYSDYIVNELLDLVNEIRSMPREYFEAKPRRVVDFNEIYTAVIPNNTPDDIRNKLNEYGINSLEYESGNNIDRIEKLNSIEGVRFSKKDSVADEVVDAFIKEYKEKNPDIKFSLLDNYTVDNNGELVHLDKGLSARPQRARYTEERIDDILETYGSDSEKYAQAYITSMSPRTFLKLTLSDEKRSEWERAEKEGTRTDEIFPLDTEQLKNESQTPFLKIDSESGEVLSHEGRHRMLAMYNAGIRNVPVVIIDNKTKYSKTITPSMTLLSQDFGEGNVNYGYKVSVTNLIPTNKVYKDKIMEAYGNKAAIKFSRKDSEYQKLYNEGDIEAAQRMVEGAAKASGFDAKVYHGTNEQFNTFKSNPFVKEISGASKIKGYFSTNPEYSKSYGDVKPYYVNTDNFFYIPDEGKTVSDWGKWFANNGLDVKLDSSIEKDSLKGYSLDDGTRLYSLWELTDVDNYWNGDGNLTSAIQNGGYNGIYWNEGYNADDISYMPFNDTAIKSAEPFTFDDSGNLIPLSKRFNTESNDIRFSQKEAIDESFEEYLDSHEKYQPYKRYFEIETQIEDMAKKMADGTLDMSETEYDNAINKLLDEQDRIVSDNDINRSYIESERGRIVNEVREEYNSKAEDLAQAPAISEEEVYDYMASHPEIYEQMWTATEADRNFTEHKQNTYAELETKVEQLKQNQKKTYGKVLDEKSVRPAMNELVKSILQASEQGRGVKKTDNKMVNDCVANAKKIFTAYKNSDTELMITTSLNAAESMVESLKFIDDSMYVYYKDLRGYLKTVPIKVDDTIKGDIPDYNMWRKSQFGKLRISDNGVPVDEVYAELCEMFPEMFSTDIANPTDQILRMAESVEEIQPYAVFLSSEEYDNLVRQTAGDLIDITVKGRAYKSMADRYEERIKAVKQRAVEAKRDAQEKKNEAVRKEREKAAEKIEAEKQKRKDSEAKLRADRDAKAKAEKDKRKEADKRRKEAYKRRKSMKMLTEDYKWLSDRILKPTDDKHVPDRMVQPLAELLQYIDLETEYSKKFEEKTGQPTGVAVNLRNLRTALEDVSKSSEANWILEDEDLPQMIEELQKRIEGAAIYELDNSELDAVQALLHAIRVDVSNANKAFVASRSIDDTAKAVIWEANEYAANSKKRRSGGIVNQLLNESMVKPMEFFEHLGPTMKSVYMGLRRGMDVQSNRMKETRAFFAEVFEGYGKKGKPGSEVQKWRNEKTLQEFELESGEKISLNTAQIMSLYCLSKREQAMGHIYGQGICASEIRDFGAIRSTIGDKDAHKKSTTMVTQKDVMNIISKLTDEQIKMADKLQDYLNTTVAEWGNETSLLMYDRKKFTEENYFPIKTQDVYLDANFEKRQRNIESIKNFGFTKGTVVNANNPIVIDDIFAVVAKHVNQMILYNAYAPAISDFTRVYNYREVEGNQVESVQAILADTYGGKIIDQYISKFMSDLQSNTQTRRGGYERVANILLANYKKAAIGASPRVALQQPTAIVRALSEIDAKYFVKMEHSPQLLQMATKKDNALKEMLEHCPIAYWKSMGFNQVDMARDIEDIMMNMEWSRLDVLTMSIYGALDTYTWSKIWKAIKAEQKDLHPEVEYESDEFWELCNERAIEVFDKTQVVDSVFHRSDVMRSDNLLIKSITSFMSEPTTTFNMLRSNLMRANDLRVQGKGKEAFKLTRRTLNVYIANAFACAMAAAIADAILKKQTGDDDDEENKSFIEFWLANTIVNFKNNVSPLNLMPITRDFSSFADGWGTKNMFEEGIALVIEDAVAIKDKATDPSSTKKTWEELITELAKDSSYLTGIPVKNFMRYGAGILDFLGINAFAAEKDSEGGQSKSLFGEILEMAGFSNGDDSANSQSQSLEAQYEESWLTKKLHEAGITEGTRLDNVLNFFGLNKSIEEQKEEHYQDMLSAAKAAGKGYVGVERDEKIYSKATDGYTKLAEAGEFEELARIRRVLVELDVDTTNFDERVESHIKTGIKKQIGEKGDSKLRNRLLNQLKEVYGYTDEQISADVLAKTDTATAFQKALCEDNYDEAVKQLRYLRQAGLTYETFIDLYEKRWKVIDAKTTGTFSWPAQGRISSGFGQRWGTLHAGIDIAMPTGTEVVASDGGEVVYTGYNSAMGNYVDIKHSNGYVTRYQHLSSYGVLKGEKVKKGQYIASSGNTGNSTGPHLHFAVYRSTSHSGCSHSTAVDPSIFLKSN